MKRLAPGKSDLSRVRLASGAPSPGAESQTNEDEETFLSEARSDLLDWWICAESRQLSFTNVAYSLLRLCDRRVDCE